MPTDQVDEFGLPIWPAAERNKSAILEELRAILPAQGGTLLEIAAATGQHAVHFAAAFPQYKYQPTDFDAEHLGTLKKRQASSSLANLLPPLALDATAKVWPLERSDAIYNANMIHIAPWEVAEGLFRGAGQLIPPGGMLVTYGPYKFDGVHTSESNERFDASLRGRDASWGVRDVSDLKQLGSSSNFLCREPIAMPANNFILVWDKKEAN